MGFKALRVYDAPQVKQVIEIFEENDLPEGDVIIKVHYSSINYKDALSSTGNKGVTRQYPHTPGVDASGIVSASTSDKWQIGDRVIVTGYDLGMNTHGGFSEYIRVPAQWVVKCPETLSLKEAMCYGTAGFTAALSVSKITENVSIEAGSVLVTGATGGVGSIAVALLSQLGYNVVAATGKPEYAKHLKDLGAAEIIHRDATNDTSGKAMLKSQYAAIIDTVGGNILSTAIKMLAYGGHVTCCGNVASPEFASSVYPFILRGVTLHGIDSVACPMPKRMAIWDKIASDWKVDALIKSVEEIHLEDVPNVITQLIEGTHKGRTIVKI